MKRLISLCLCLVLVVGIVPLDAWAAEETPEAEITTEMLASDLKTLGLFKGVSDTDFALERKPTRTEALVMLIRVLGQEQTALNGTWEHPFTDVAAWADPYVGYAYTNGLTNGVSDTKFGSSNIAPDYMYLTFVLRALGYSDSNGDFTWNSPYDLASDVGILPKEYNKNNFLRGDVVNISYAALNALMKDSQKTMADSLIECGAFSEETFDEIYRLGAVELDINPFTEVRKMIKQYGEYDEKTGTYSLVVDDVSDPKDRYKAWERSDVFSYSEADGKILLRHDSYTHHVSNDGGKQYEAKDTDYYFILLAESEDKHTIEGYEKHEYRFAPSNWETEVTTAVGTLHPEKWTGSYDYPYNWKGMVVNQGHMQYEFTQRDSGIWSLFVSSFALYVDLLIDDLESAMTKYGLTTTLDDFGFNRIPPEPTNYLSELPYESNINNEDVDRLLKYDMTYDSKRHKSYSEGAAYYDQYSMEDYYGGRSADFKNIQEAHEYLSTVFSEQERIKSEKLGLDGVASSFDVLMNLFMAEAAAELAYESKNVEVKFHTSKDLLYHAEDHDSSAVNVRGVCEFNVKNNNTVDWTQEDYAAIKKVFQSSSYLKQLSLPTLVSTGNLPRYLDVDVHLSTTYMLSTTNIMILDYADWNALVQSKITVRGVKNGTVSVQGAGTSATVKSGESSASEMFYAGGGVGIRCTPDPGYWLSDLIINGKSVGPEFTYDLDITGEDITVEAVFEKIKDPVKITLSLIIESEAYNESGIYIFVDGISVGSINKRTPTKEIFVPSGTEITAKVTTGVVGTKFKEVLINGESQKVEMIRTEYTLSVSEEMTISATF